MGVSSGLNTLYVWASIIGGIATGATVLFYVLRSIIRGSRDAILEYLRGELEPNSGGSLRDAVDEANRKIDAHIISHRRGYFAD